MKTGGRDCGSTASPLASGDPHLSLAELEFGGDRTTNLG
jgi:hypothetical protein